MEQTYSHDIKNGNGAKTATGSIQEGLGRVADSVKKECANMGDHAAEYADKAVAQAKDAGSMMVSNLEECVKARPLQSILTVAAAGYLVGRLCRH